MTLGDRIAFVLLISVVIGVAILLGMDIVTQLDGAEIEVVSGVVV